MGVLFKGLFDLTIGLYYVRPVTVSNICWEHNFLIKKHWRVSCFQLFTQFPKTKGSVQPYYFF